MNVTVSVVVPAYDAAATLSDCLRALRGQNLERSAYEIIVVDDGSTDDTATIAEDLADTVVRRPNGGASVARNDGLARARAGWIAFIDADCVPSRGWLRALLAAAESSERDGTAIVGVAGKTVGLASESAAARFVDLIGSLDAERHLSHPRFPFAPSGNVMYRRTALLAVGGYDASFPTYEACDLHQRLATGALGRCAVAPAAIAFHRHRATWHAYWKQQRAYGVGMACFMRRYRESAPWSFGRELRAWGELALLALAAARPGSGDAALVRRGTFVKAAAQRVGFVGRYWRRQRPAGDVSRLPPKWSPAGIVVRARHIIEGPGDAVLTLRIGWFLYRAPRLIARMPLDRLLMRFRRAPRASAPSAQASLRRVERLREPWLRLRWLADRNTCYMRALTTYTFLDAGEQPVRIHFGVETRRPANERLRGHAWVSAGGEFIEGPDDVSPEHLREIVFRNR